MVYSVQKYRCELCHSEYESVDGAIVCESLGRPDPRFKVGDEITYGTEDSLTGTRWCYSGAKGEVQGRRLILVVRNSDGQKSHVWLYACRRKGESMYAGILDGVMDVDGTLESPYEGRGISMGPEFDTVKEEKANSEVAE